MSEETRAHMLRALELAERGWGQTAPNPMVGAVLVQDGQVVGEGWHQRYGGPHAEVNAIAAARYRARGAHLIVTLEPCRHYGKTPPCTDAVIDAGIEEVTVGALDPTPAGGGAGLLREAGLQVEIGCEARAARELNAPFHFAATADQPWVTLKLAVSADGCIAPPPSEDGRRASARLAGTEAQVEVHRLRAGADAIAVGVGTVLADDPQLTVRHYAQPRVPPLRVVFDRDARTPFDSCLVRTARTIPTMVIARAHSARTEALTEHGVSILLAPDLPAALRLLRSRSVYSLLVEGGAGVSGALLNADAVDRVVLIQCPITLGQGALDPFAGVRSRDAVLQSLEPLAERRLGEDVMKVYAVSGHDV